MLEACKKDLVIFEKIIQSYRDDKIFYLRLQPAASITCLGLPKFEKRNILILQCVPDWRSMVNIFFGKIKWEKNKAVPLDGTRC